MIVQESLIVHEINTDLPDTNIIKIKLKNEKYLQIVNCYRSPKTKIEIDKLTEEINKSREKNDHLMILGDFNAYSGLWYETKTDSRGRQMEKLIKKNKI